MTETSPQNRRLGYARVSTHGQTLDAQLAQLRADGCARIYREKSFARAAEHLGLSASALSQTIRQLETRLGVRLLNRTTRSVAPTSAGARLCERIMPVMREMDAAVAEAVEATGRTDGTLRITEHGRTDSYRT